MKADAAQMQRIDQIYDRLLAAIDGARPVDIMPALETLVANLICDWSDSKPDAMRGLDAVRVDMDAIVDGRFRQKARTN